MIDEKTLEFIALFNTKPNRKHIAKYIFTKGSTPVKGGWKTNIQLIKMFCRMVATLTQNHKETKNELLKLLQKEYADLMQTHDILNVQTKKKNCLIICEMTKFGLIDTEIILTRFKECIDDVKNSSEVLFAIVESIGKFLQKKEQMEGFSKLSFNNMLDRLWDMKVQAVLSDKALQYVENAYFYCRPSESASLNRQTELNEEEQHIHSLLFEKLNEETVAQVVKELKKVDIKKNEDFLVESIIRFCRIGTFYDLDTICNVCYSLKSTFLKSIVTKVEQTLKNNIVSRMDDLSQSGYQSRIQEINFISTLYFYDVVETPLLFEILYVLVPEGSYSTEKADASFRIRLACTLLENLSMSGFKDQRPQDVKRAKVSLAQYIAHFQTYVYNQKRIPIEVDYLFMDTMEQIKQVIPNAKVFKTAPEAVQKAIVESKAKLRVFKGFQIFNFGYF